MRIALDAMGGDHAPSYPVQAAIQALANFPHITRLVLVGDEDVLRQELARHKAQTSDRLDIFHATQVIEMTDGAVEAVRRKKDSSMNRAIDLLKEGAVDAVVSAGNTGALIASATIKLRNLPGVDRAGIATPIPNKNGVFVLLDAGASVDATPEHLLAYAVMGEVYCSHLFKVSKPKVGLLSNGTESGKGNELTKEAFQLLSKAPLDFIGNVEGYNLFNGSVDVVVCDGFIGNIVLKTMESMAKATFNWLKEEITSSPVRILGAWMAKGAFQNIKRKTSADECGGALLLGVNGICVKAHGSSSVRALYNSLRVANEAVENQVNPHIVEALARLQKHSNVTQEPT